MASRAGDEFGAAEGAPGAAAAAAGAAFALGPFGPFFLPAPLFAAPSAAATLTGAGATRTGEEEEGADAVTGEGTDAAAAGGAAAGADTVAGAAGFTVAAGAAAVAVTEGVALAATAGAVAAAAAGAGAAALTGPVPFASAAHDMTEWREVDGRRVDQRARVGRCCRTRVWGRGDRVSHRGGIGLLSAAESTEQRGARWPGQDGLPASQAELCAGTDAGDRLRLEPIPRVSQPCRAVLLN